ncbi:MAG: CHASE2 domain-containing protein, partial [Patescibacteria group bacterium]|nr:CHASE2 domain-containing protein [Patescibacteria group bacterium]
MSRFLSKQWLEKSLFAVMLLAIGLVFTFTNLLQRWDRSIYDLLSGGAVRTPPDDIVIISIDETSLARFGRWPWPRHIHAGLIDKLSRGGAKVIGFDIVLAEADLIAPEDDQSLAVAIARSGRVILPIICEGRPGKPLRLTPPLPEFAGVAAGLGHLVFELDSDGIMRRAFLKAGLGSPDWPDFALAMLRFNDPAFAENLPGVRNKNLHSASPINWVRDYEVLVPFADAPGFFPRISYAHFLEADFDADIVRDKFVFVGATALGLGDALPTPVSGETVPMPGVEINANLLDALRTGIVIEPLGVTQTLLLTCFL